MRKSIKFGLFIGLFVAVGAYFFYRNSTRVLTVEFASVEVGDLVLAVSAPGEIRSEYEANLNFSSTGKLIYLPFKTGDTVTKGEALASIDGTQILKNLENARIDKRKAENFADEIRETYEGNLDEGPGLYKLKQAQKAIQQAENQIKIYENSLFNFTLSAPFAGTIIEINKKVGETVSQPIIKLADLENLYFEALIDEEDTGRILINSEAAVELDAYPDVALFGEVSEIARTTSFDSAGNKIVKTKIRLRDFSNGVTLRLGLSGDVEVIQQTKKQILIVPVEAIFKEQGKSFVYSIEAGEAKKREIRPGLENDDVVEISAGLREKEKVIVSDLEKITDGQKVTVDVD